MAEFSYATHDWDTECVTYEKDGILFSKWTLESYFDAIKNFAVRNDDIWVVTYPKAGTTWAQHIISLILVDGDHEKLSGPIHLRLPFIDMGLLPHYSLLHGAEFTHPYKLLETISSPRIIKSHLLHQYLPDQLFEKNAKVIYVGRNPKDNMVSYFHFHTYNRVFPKYTDWNKFYDDFMKNRVAYGSWFDHNLFWWERRHHTNVLFLKYEDMKKDLKGTVIQISDFIGHQLADDVIDQVEKHSTFTSMKKNPDTNPDDVAGLFNPDVYKTKGFVRKGQIGDWKNYFTVAQNEEFEKVYRMKMIGSSLRFDFGI